jgi:hypothetical protein
LTLTPLLQQDFIRDQGFSSLSNNAEFVKLLHIHKQVDKVGAG